ncbi:MAG: RidA family protein [Candidatus Margulisiibacteriota bacterium]
MSKRIIQTDLAPAPVGTYSQAVLSQGILYISGQIPLDPKTGQLVTTDFDSAARQTLTNLKAIVEAAGLTLADVVKVSVFLKDMDRFADFNAVYATFFTSPYPARAVVEVARLPKDVPIEIEAIAHTGAVP